MKNASQEQADAFTEWMLKRFGGTLIKQEVISSVLSSVLAGFDPTQIIHAITPSIGITVGGFVYRKAGLSPDEQMGLIVHECAHLAQEKKYGILKDWGLYIAHAEARARLECEGYYAGLEWHYARTKQLPSLDALVEPLRHGYFLDDKHIGMCRQLLESQATTVVAGIVATPQVIAAMEWLEANARELLA